MLYQTAPPSQGTSIFHLVINRVSLLQQNFGDLLLAGGFGYMLGLKVFLSKPKMIVHSKMPIEEK